MKSKENKNNFFRIMSPPTLAVVAVLDCAVAYFAYFAVKKLIAFTTIYAVFFAIMELFAIVIAILVTKNVLTQGIIFNDDFMEFTALDEANIIEYAKIKSVETSKDCKASLVKNFNDRHSMLIFQMDDGSTITIDIGLTTAKTLKSVSEKIKNHIES